MGDILFCSHDRNKYETEEWRHVLSQWYQSKFVDNSKVEYTSCEQYMMAQKAKLFNDNDIYEKIIKTNNPKTIKDLGRQIKNFDQHLWDKNKFNIVVNGNTLKFSQNKNLKNILTETQNRYIAEAASYDKIWGIGLDEKSAKKIPKSEWTKHGENLLGKALMMVRDKLL